jgi:hypothetical protein
VETIAELPALASSSARTVPEFKPLFGCDPYALDPSLTTPDTVYVGTIVGGTKVAGGGGEVGAVGLLAYGGNSCCAHADKPRRRQMQIVRMSAVISIAFIVAACSPVFPAQPSTPAELASIAVMYPVAGFRTVPSASGQFEAYAVDTDGVYLRVTNEVLWGTSDTSRIVLDRNRPGFVSLGPAGAADLIVVYRGSQANLPLDVRSLSIPRLTIELPRTLSSAGLFLSTASGSFTSVPSLSATWTSSDESIATVDVIGKVTARKVGNVRITATRDGLTDFFWMSVPPRSK